jgi:hypothetical protein
MPHSRSASAAIYGALARASHPLAGRCQSCEPVLHDVVKDRLHRLSKNAPPKLGCSRAFQRSGHLLRHEWNRAQPHADCIPHGAHEGRSSRECEPQIVRRAERRFAARGTVSAARRIGASLAVSMAYRPDVGRHRIDFGR